MSSTAVASKRSRHGVSSSAAAPASAAPASAAPSDLKRPKVSDTAVPVQVVFEDDDSATAADTQSSRPVAPPSTPNTTTVAAPPAKAASVVAANAAAIVADSEVRPERFDWTVLSDASVFKDLIKVSTMTTKRTPPSAYINCDARKYRDLTGVHVRPRNGALTIETPYLKCVTGLKDSIDYPGSFSMRCSPDDDTVALATGENLTAFAEFAESVDEFLLHEVIEHAYAWLKDFGEAKGTDIVQGKNPDGPYIGQQKYAHPWYENLVRENFEGMLRAGGESGGTFFHFKVYPQKVDKSTPDVIIFNQDNKQESYAASPLREKGNYVKCFIRLTSLTYVKTKFYATWVCYKLKYKTAEQVQGAGGAESVQCDFSDVSQPTVQTRKFVPPPTAEGGGGAAGAFVKKGIPPSVADDGDF